MPSRVRVFLLADVTYPHVRKVRSDRNKEKSWGKKSFGEWKRAEQARGAQHEICCPADPGTVASLLTCCPAYSFSKGRRNCHQNQLEYRAPSS